MITAQKIRGCLRTPVVKDIPIEVFPCIGSTNDEAKRYARGRTEGRALIVAGCQSAGRGRLGRSFLSPEGRGVYMSLLLINPNLSPKDAPLITAYAATVVRKAIFELTSLDAKIKWVNDITHSDKKLAGILTEGTLSPSGSYEWCIVGIGINTHGSDFPPEIADIATSLESLGVSVVREELIARITELFFEGLDTVGTSEAAEEYRRHSSVIGRRVTVIKQGESYPATVIGIGERCELLINNGGTTETLISGEVSILPYTQNERKKRT